MKSAVITKLICATLLLVFAANANASRANQDFGSLIEENAAAQRLLSRELQQQLKTKDLGKTENPNFNKVGEQVIGREQSENVAVETSDTTRVKTKVSSDFEKKNFNRLSQEIKDLK